MQPGRVRRVGMVDEGTEDPAAGEHADHEQALDGIGQAAVFRLVAGQQSDRRIDRDLGQRKRNADAGEQQFGGVEARIQRHQQARRADDRQCQHHRAPVTQQGQERGDQQRGHRDGQVLEQFQQAGLWLVHAEGVDRLQDHRAHAVEQDREHHVDQCQCSDHAQSVHGRLLRVGSRMKSDLRCFRVRGRSAMRGRIGACNHSVPKNDIGINRVGGIIQAGLARGKSQRRRPVAMLGPLIGGLAS